MAVPQSSEPPVNSIAVHLMVALSSTSYLPISQEDEGENHVRGRESPALPVSRPAIYYNDGEFSPPSSTDDLTTATEKRSDRHAFLDDDDYADDRIPFSGMESGGRVGLRMVKCIEVFSGCTNPVSCLSETSFSSQSSNHGSRSSYNDFDFDRCLSCADLHRDVRPVAR
jgi:hypothetical protein